MNTNKLLLQTTDESYKYNGEMHIYSLSCMIQNQAKLIYS